MRDLLNLITSSSCTAIGLFQLVFLAREFTGGDGSAFWVAIFGFNYVCYTSYGLVTGWKWVRA